MNSTILEARMQHRPRQSGDWPPERIERSILNKFPLSDVIHTQDEVEERFDINDILALWHCHGSRVWALSRIVHVDAAGGKPASVEYPFLVEGTAPVVVSWLLSLMATEQRKAVQR